MHGKPGSVQRGAERIYRYRRQIVGRVLVDRLDQQVCAVHIDDASTGADPVDQRDDQMKLRGQRAGIAAETFDRKLFALEHGFHAYENQRNGKNEKNQHENSEGRQHDNVP